MVSLRQHKPPPFYNINTILKVWSKVIQPKYFVTIQSDASEWLLHHG